MRSVLRAFSQSGFLLAFDGALIVLCLGGAAGATPFVVSTFAASTLFIFWLRGLYDPEIYLNHRVLFIRGLPAAGASLGLLALAEAVGPAPQLGPALAAGALSLAFGLQARLGYGALTGGRARPRLLVLGLGARARRIGREIAEAGRHEIVGFVGNDPARVGERLGNPHPIGAVLGTYDDLEAILAREAPSSVVVAEEDRRRALPMKVLLRHKLRGGRVYDAATFLEATAGKIPLEGLLPSWFVFSEGFLSSPLRAFFRRVLEVAISIVLLVVTLPVALVVALLIRLESRGPVLFRQERVGEDGRIFRIVKFRSMRADAEEGTGPVWARESDPRVTCVGRWIRRLRIDEIPQLWNVLRGDMALVGPRPERPHFVVTLRERIPYYDERHTVKPGLTGWAQINYPYGSTLEDADAKLQYDFYYIKHRSPLFDLYIVARTIKVVLLGLGGR